MSPTVSKFKELKNLQYLMLRWRDRNTLSRPCFPQERYYLLSFEKGCDICSAKESEDLCLEPLMHIDLNLNSLKWRFKFA